MVTHNFNKYVFQYDAYRPLVARISQHALCRGCLLPGGVCFWGGMSASRGCVCFPGVCLLPGGCLLPGEVSTSWGCLFPGGCIPACTEADTPHGQNSWHTLLKILPCPNFVAGGKKIGLVEWNDLYDVYTAQLMLSLAFLDTTMYSFSTRLHEDTDLNDGAVIFGTVNINIGGGYDEFTGLMLQPFLPPTNNVSRKAQYKDVCTRTIEIPQQPHIFQAHCCLKVHNAHWKLASPFSG